MIHHPSPNFGPRRNGESPGLVVLHYTEMISAEAALARLCAPESEVSAHYLIGRDGTLWQMIDETQRAWHAGAGGWKGQGDVNSRSIGIELDNDGTSPFAAPLMITLEALLAQIRARWRIQATGVIAHSDLAPGRKIDPGARFDWRRLARLGHGVWPSGPCATDRPLGALLDAIGYPPAPDPIRLAAFRLRFRPGVTGVETAADRAIAAAVLHASEMLEK